MTVTDRDSFELLR